MAKELSQPEQRKYRTYRDQHGRKWGAPYDIRTGHSVGPWEPKFEAPWLPDDKYIRHDRTDDGLIFLDYAQQARDYRTARSEYERFRERKAMDTYGSAWIKMLGNTVEEDPPELRRLIGNPPRSPVYAEAALEGNKWVLGFTKEMPSWAKRLQEVQSVHGRKYLDADEEADRYGDLEEAVDPEVTGGHVVKVKTAKAKRAPSAYNRFVAEQARAGIKDMKTISALWKERAVQTA